MGKNDLTHYSIHLDCSPEFIAHLEYYRNYFTIDKISFDSKDSPVFTFGLADPMAYNEKLAERIRGAIFTEPDIEEKKMFGGLCFLINGKMCVCVKKDEIMCRIDPEKYEQVLEKKKCRPMVHNGRLMKGFVFVKEEDIKSKKEFDFWMVSALEFNKEAKQAPKRKKKAKPRNFTAK